MNYEATLKSGIVLAQADEKLELAYKVDRFVKSARERITDDIIIWDGYRIVGILRYSRSNLLRAIHIGENGCAEF